MVVMNTLIGCMYNPKNENHIMIPEVALGAAQINLDEKEVWDIGIDQSTSCTGLTIMNAEETVAGTFDLHRDRSLDDRVFYRELKQFLTRLVANKKVRILVFEKPVPNPRFKSAQHVLYELKGRLEEWVYEIPELENAKIFDSIYPQTWKSLVMDKSAGKNRANKKIEIARDMIKLFPALREYGQAYPYTDYDGFDSLGILTGFKRYAFNEVGMEQIHGTIEKRHTAVVYYFTADKAMKFDEVFKAAFGDLSVVTDLQGMKFLAYNLRYKFNENIRMASSGNYPVMTMLPPNTHDYVKWEFNLDTENKNVFAFIFKKSALGRSNYNAFCNILPAFQEVYGE